jgi:hypothetical protein
MNVLIAQVSASTMATAMMPMMIFLRIVVFAGAGAAGSRVGGGVVWDCFVACSVVVPMLLFLCVV